jgi:hypothetical protein
MADGNPCATLGHGHEQLPRGLLLCSEVVGTVHWDERDSQQPRKWPFPIHAVALTMKFSVSEDTMTVTFLTLLEVLATYMILRLCEQLLKALIRGRKIKPTATRRMIQRLTKNGIGANCTHLKWFGYQITDNVIMWMPAAVG